MMKFDIQRFADTVTSSYDLKVGLKFSDADTRIITIPDPDNNLDETTIKDAFTDIISNNIFIGDKTGATLEGLYTAYRDDITRRKLDLS